MDAAVAQIRKMATRELARAEGPSERATVVNVRFEAHHVSAVDGGGQEEHDDFPEVMPPSIGRDDAHESLDVGQGRRSDILAALVRTCPVDDPRESRRQIKHGTPCEVCSRL